MPVLDDAVDGWMRQYPFFLPETDRPLPPSQNVLEIPPAIPAANYGINPWTGDPMPDPRSVLRRTQPPINAATDALQTGQIANPVMRVLALPQEAIYRATQPGAVSMLGPQRGEVAANVLSMVVPLLMGDLGGRVPEEVPRATGSLPPHPTVPFPGGLEYLPSSGSTPNVTQPLFLGSLREAPEAGVRPLGFHGSTEPILEQVPADVATYQGNLYGPGTYETVNESVAKGYADTAGKDKGMVHRVYGINPKMKLLDLDNDKMPPEIYERVQEILKKNEEGADPTGVRVDPKTGEVHDESYVPQQLALWSRVKRYFHPLKEGEPGYKYRTQLNQLNPEMIFRTLSNTDPVFDGTRQALQQALEEKGYTGLTHEGGRVTGGVRHQVRIHWHPNEDIRMRAMQPYWSKEVMDWKAMEKNKTYPWYMGPQHFRTMTRKVPAPEVLMMGDDKYMEDPFWGQ